MSDLVHLNTKAKAVSDCFTKLANQKTYQCQWRTNDQWARLVWSFYRDVLSPYFIKEDLDGKTLDMALRKDKLIKINLSNYTVGTNATGIMCRFFSPRLIINDKEIKIRTYCYISVPPFTAEPQPPTGKKWFDTLPPTKTRESQRCKRVRSDDPELETNEENTVDSIADNQPESDCCVKMQMDYEYDPWDDIKVRKLFAPLEDEHPMDAIARRIDIFMEARKTVEGYKNLIIGGDPYDNCTEVDKIKLQDKAIYLIAALRFALSSYPKSTWTECCEKASETCSALTTPYCQRTVRDWWSAFKVNDGFIHPRGAEGQSKKSREHLPPFLRDNEDLQKKFIRHCTNTLNELSIDSAREFVIEQLIPNGFPLTSDFTDQNRKDMLRRLYGLIDTPARSTIWEWLVRCGFTYTKRKKRYFVDTHESAANRKYRKEQTARYLRRERRMHRWYQLPLNEVNTLISEGLLVPGKGYNYETINGEKMVEFHVDDIPEINVIDNKTENKLRTKIEEECLYGGNLSVRKEPEEKPLLAFGHDECIFRQFIFTGLAWVGVKGELPIIPKDEGFGIMVSAFQSREFGFGFALTLDNLKAVNEFRTLHRPNYTETESAIKILGNAKKKDLSESPFVKYFEYGYGQGKEGYWTYDHMAIQFEDCVDCIQCLFPQFDSVWQFDHSCGHDRGRDDGLNVSNMSVNWGGKQRKLRSTQMLQEEGFLGPHSPKLTVGDFQSMVFENEDDGPFYMPPNLQQIRKHDEVRGKKIKNRLKKDLCEELDRIGISTRGKTLKEVQEIANANNLPIATEEDDIVEGWLGKPKGIKQVLWERGLLNPEVQYVAKVKKDDPNEAGKVEYSTLLANCTDFLSEKTCLMFLGERLDVEVDRSTKCHPELAGEGIEYTWGRAKGLYRKAKLYEKKGKENFQSLVQRCLSTETGKGKGCLTPAMIRKFSRRARCYILTYFWIEHGMEESIKVEELSEINIERIKKEFKTHRNAIDFDEKFINHCFSKIKNES